MVLSHLDKYDDIVVQVHDNPDADAVGSGYAIYTYFKSKGKNVRLVYGGKNRVSKINMKLLIEELEIPLEYVGDRDTLVIGDKGLLITVDCQYGEGNVQMFWASNVAMIDHHSTGRKSDEMAEIRNNLVSCATVCYALLKNEGYDINAYTRVATALFYGLYMDSSQLSEISHPLDRDMVDFLKYDKMLVNKLKYANFDLSELETAGIAISNNNYMEKYRLAVVMSKPCDPNILGVIGDFVIQVDSINTCVIYNECFGGYKLSVRSCTLEVAANELVTLLTAGIGNGGGHINKAGGFISEARFNEEYEGKDIKEYIFEKAEEYYNGYNVVNYSRPLEDYSGFKPYRKKNGICGYVPTTEVFEKGTECKIRTLEGDVFVTCREDIYLMIGQCGEVYPIEKAVFESKYRPLEDAYIKKVEYTPSVINMTMGTTTELMTYAKQCINDDKSVLMAREIDKFTKVFTSWDYESYMAGNKGDMLCYREGSPQDIYVIRRDIFEMTYDSAL